MWLLVHAAGRGTRARDASLHPDGYFKAFNLAESKPGLGRKGSFAGSISRHSLDIYPATFLARRRKSAVRPVPVARVAEVMSPQ